MNSPRVLWFEELSVIASFKDVCRWRLTFAIGSQQGERGGTALGFNEAAGYGAVSLTALATGAIAARYGLRPEPFFLGIAFAALGLGLSTLFVRETQGHAVYALFRLGFHSDELVERLLPLAFDRYWVARASVSAGRRSGSVPRACRKRPRASPASTGVVPE